MKKLYSALALLIVVIFFVGFIFWRYFYLGTLTIDPVPTDAIVKVDGKAMPDRTLRLPQGQYTLEVTSLGYRTQRFNVAVGVGSQTTKRVTLENLPKPSKVLEGKISSLAATSDSKQLFFKSGEALYTLPLEAPAGSPAVPITPVLSNVNKVVWSPDFKLAVLQKTDGEAGLYDFSRYDFVNQTYTALDKNTSNTVWAPDGSGFYSLYKTDSEYNIVTRTKAGTGLNRLWDMRTFPFADVKMVAGKANILYLANSDTKKAGDIFLFNAHERGVIQLTDTGAAYGPVTSPDGNSLVYADNGELVSADSGGKNKKNLGVRAKIGNYTFIDNNRLAVFTSNLVSVINLADGKAENYEVYAPSDSIAGLVADSSGKSLYYIYNEELYRVDFVNQPATSQQQ